MKGRVLKTTGSWYAVKLENGNVIDCRIKGKLRLDESRHTNPVTVGDWVSIDNEEGSGETVIESVDPRENYIIRQSPRAKHQKHIIAANIDQAVLLVTISQPRTSFGFIDRFLVAAACFHIPVIIVVNKTDLLRKKDFEKLEDLEMIYKPLGYQIEKISIIKKEGLAKIKELMSNKTTLLSGHSGAGKSSLINVLEPGLNLKVGEISRKWEKGIHTTTFSNMHELWENTYIIDTPGIKEFALTEIEPDELGGYFPEIYKKMKECQFNNCLHTTEPGCAVKNAVEAGEISIDRFTNYFNILADIQSANHWERG